MKNVKRKRFTLLELLVVITIIVILMALTTVAAQRFMIRGKIMKARGHMADIKAAVTAYQKDYGVFPLVTPGSRKPNLFSVPLDNFHRYDDLTLTLIPDSVGANSGNPRKIQYMKGYGTELRSPWAVNTATGAKNNYTNFGYMLAMDFDLSGSICSAYIKSSQSRFLS